MTTQRRSKRGSKGATSFSPGRLIAAAEFARTTATVAQVSAPIRHSLIQHAHSLGLPDLAVDPDLNDLWKQPYRPDAGDRTYARLIGMLEPTEGEEQDEEKLCLKIAAVFAIQAVKAEAAGEVRAAWSQALQAAAWEGFISGAVAAGDGRKALRERMRELSGMRRSRATPAAIAKFAMAQGFTGARGTQKGFVDEAMRHFNLGKRQVERLMATAREKRLMS